jgi:hypothetical protein
VRGFFPSYPLPLTYVPLYRMVIATYKRDQNLPPLLKHLTTNPPPSLRHIVLVWQNVGVPLPNFLNSTALDAFSTSGVAVTVRESKRNSMNERFRPLLGWDEEIYTDAVMIMDDDVVLRRDALEWGYQEFDEANRYGPGRLVGFTGRDFEAEGEEWSYVVRPTKTYSMVLSNAAWLKKEWLKKYWEETEEMKSLRDYVDEGTFSFPSLSSSLPLWSSQCTANRTPPTVFNCDDILINYLVSNLTGTPPLLLQPKTPLRTIGGDGLWNRASVAVSDDEDTSAPPPAPDAGIPTAGHFGQRKECLARYFSHFSSFAPSTSSSSKAALAAARHYPLIKTSSSVSQDVEDHSRWLFRNEAWEELNFAAMVAQSEPVEEEEEEELTPEEVEEREMFDKMLEGMTDEEIDELMKSLQEMAENEEEDDEEGLPSNGEEGLGAQDEEASVFEGAEDEQLVFGHASGEL